MMHQVFRYIPVMACIWVAAASAADITLSGTVVAASCTVDTGTKEQTVRFQQARAVDYTTVGNTSEWQDVDLTLSACPLSTRQVTVSFSGDADDIDPTKFANIQGDATGMALELMSRDHLTEIPPQGQMTVDVDRTTRGAVFPLSARMYTPTGNVTAGEFKAVVQFSFTYQ
ncbi:fimbrial protein [Superficieibacter sp. HKU1]|uniref:fimbrial protein n=1 Tax=Superficieibacter sp. HKU1 TaxID=3031919 RepID=UPI0023E1AE4A|nr:fimbrial protein [Superficieibacter sp. HKU1]WES69611.1 fimbrial protein [Superficieibacter sp. HKU1]